MRSASADPLPPRRLRVLHVQDKCGLGGAQIQGVQRLLLWWWPELIRQDVDPSICILRARNEASRHFDANSIPVIHLGRGRFDPRAVSDLVSLIRSRNIDVLHGHGYGATTLGRVAGLVTRTPVIVHEHWIDPEIPAYQRVADRLLAPVTARAIGVSAAVGEFLITRRHVPRERVMIIPNAPPDSFFQPPAPGARTAAAIRLGLDPRARYVAAVGRLHAVKGYDVYLDAARHVVDRTPDGLSPPTFLLIGDGDEHDALARRCRSLNLDAHVRFVGHRDDVGDLLPLFDVFVMSSRSEGFPLSLVEAMATGRPIAATAVGGIPEIIESGRTGLLVPAGDGAALGDAIASLAFDDVRARALGNAAAAECREHYRLDAVVARFVDLYRELASHPTVKL